MEKGDNASTLAAFLGVSQDKAEKIFSTMKDETVALPDDISGVPQINEVIADYTKYPLSYGQGSSTDRFKTLYQEDKKGANIQDYNCYPSGLSITSGKSVRRNVAFVEQKQIASRCYIHRTGIADAAQFQRHEPSARWIIGSGGTCGLTIAHHADDHPGSFPVPGCRKSF